MHFSEIFFDILIILAASILVVSLFKRAKTSAILGYLTSGIILGPTGLAIIEQSENLNTLAEVGVVFLLFMIGLEFSVSKLRSLFKYVVGLGGLQVVLTASIIALVAIGFAFEPSAAAIIGGGLALSSTAFVLQFLTERGERDTRHGKLALAILLFQDLAIVPLLILLTVLADSQASFLASLGIAIGEAALSLGIVYILGRIIFPRLYRMIARAEESDLIIGTTLLLIFGIGWFLSLFNVSMALGGFLAGLLLAETEFRHQIEADIKPFKGLLLGLFFMTVGMTIDIGLLLGEIDIILALVAGLITLKAILITGLSKLFKIDLGNSLRVGLLLGQGGEFGFVLFLSAGTLGLLASNDVQILLTSIAVTMAVTPLLAALGQKVQMMVIGKQSKEFSVPTEKVEDLKGHAIIVGYGRVGQTIAHLMKETGQDAVALDLDIDRVQNCGGASQDIFYGDAKQISVLRSIGIDRAECIIITIDDTYSVNDIIHAAHQIAPKVRTYVRARDIDHVHLLEEHDTVRAVPETVEGSLQLAAIVLKDFGVDESEALKIIEAHRENLYKSLNEKSAE
jgi:CPA2 family monovalent cation:H+ antiporter-2